MKYDVVVVGAGLGGLETAYILAKNGLGVCVLEKGMELGGCLQNFKRKGFTYDTGFHYVGALDEGYSLHRLFSYFNLMDLPWHKLDEDYFDEVVYKGRSYKFANGYERFVETLAMEFPKQKENLKKYTEFLKGVGDNIFNTLMPSTEQTFDSLKLFGASAYQFLKETISDDDLINILTGTSLKLETKKETLPLYTFAQINDSFIRSAHRIKGGGGQVCETLARHIEGMGGVVRKRAEVSELIERNGEIAVARLTNGEEIEGRIFVSNLHPAQTLGLVKESEKIRKVYRNRIIGLENTTGMFTANIRLKKSTIPYLNRNQFIYEGDCTPWNCCEPKEGRVEACLVSYQVPEDGGEYADNIDLIVPMKWQDVEKWQGTNPMRRGSEYESLKNQFAEKAIELAERHISGFKEAVSEVYSSTPLTYADYVASPHGSAYGIRKDFNKPMQTVFTSRTPIANLLLTGQSLNLHGVLGVSMTSFFTAAEIIGKETVVRELRLEE